MKKLLLIILIILFGLASISFAARPFSVEDAGVAEEGFEVEISQTRETAGDSLAHETGFVVNIATMKNFHIGFEKPFTTAIVKGAPDHPWGNGDLVITAKYALPEEQSFKLSMKNTEGDEVNGFGNEFIEFGLLYAKETQLTDIKYYLNLGYNFYDRSEWYSEDVKNNWFLGIGQKKSLNKNIDLCAEITKIVVQGDYIDNLDGYVNGMLGIVWTINDVPIDFSYNSIPDSKDYTYSIGTTLAF